MKYLIMVYGNPSTAAYFESMTEEQRRQAVRGHRELQEALVASGEFVTSASLQGPSTGRRVSVGDGRTVVTDGPFAEVKEHLAGFYLVDCASEERALEIAGQVAAADSGEAEVRPLRNL